MEQKRVLVLGSLNEFVSLTKLAKKRGYYTIVCDGYPDGTAKQYADKAYNINIHDVDAISDLCRKEHVDGVIGSFSDVVFESITKIADRVGLKWYITPDMLPYYREKNIAKECMREAGIKTPKSCTLTQSFSDDELNGFHFPLVIKPINGYGSKGIVVVQSVNEIRKRYEDVVAFSDIKLIQAEEYMDGYEYNITTWLKDGEIYVIGLGDREKNPQEGENVPVLTRMVYPAKETEKIVGEAVDVIRRFAELVGQRNGPLAMQFFYNEHGVEVCEITARILAFEQELFLRCSGTDVLDLMLDYLFDPEHELQILKQHSCHYRTFCSAIYFVGKNGYKIADFSSAEKLAKDKHVYRYDPYYKEGDIIDHVHGSAYLAAYYITASTLEELDLVTAEFYQNFTVKDSDGTELATRFQLEKRSYQIQQV